MITARCSCSYYFTRSFKDVSKCRVGQKSKLLILSEYVNKTENIGGMYKKIRIATEKMKYCLIFSREIFYVTVALCLSIL